MYIYSSSAVAAVALLKTRCAEDILPQSTHDVYKMKQKKKEKEHMREKEPREAHTQRER